ncbi:SNP29 protein, partial [Corythaeola cristata]|nr:SNP29 protein [Corythaeola cristata]
MSALPRSYNPFAEEEEEEAAAWPAKGSGEAGGAERQRYLQQEVLRRSAATADSTARSLSLLYESERIGVAASEVGRGPAGRAEKGALSPWGARTAGLPCPALPAVSGLNLRGGKLFPPNEACGPYECFLFVLFTTRLKEAMMSSKEQESKYQESHPNLRKLDNSDNDFSKADLVSSVQSDSYPKNQHLRAYHQKIDNNLDEMSSGLSRLKNLALGLQTEIDEQDDMLDRLTKKVETLDINIKSTDKKVRQL